MNKRLLLLFLTFFSVLHLISQNGLIRSFPKSAFTAQFAGSTGLYTFGFSKVTKRDKLEIGLLYGRVPKAYGGVNNSLVLKFTYNPFHIDLLKKFRLEPLQTGIFINQNFNSYSKILWGDNYPKGYYWWTRSTRFHFFLGAQIAYKLDTKRLDRIAMYFEANTNDLYLYSYLPNKKSLSLYDIFFFGAGIKLYLK